MLEIKNRKVRNILKVIVPFVLIPTAVIVGAVAVDEGNYIFVSLLVATLTVILFIAGFEKKEIGTRRMVIVSVMIALSVVGRFIPFFKPVTALTVIAAIYLGSEAGFAVGAFSALLSNFYFGQGPWTPFQMLAWGLIGLIAGLLADPLRKSRVFLLSFGAVSGIAFSALMDVWTVLWYNEGFNIALYISALMTSAPYILLYAVSNFAFLYFLAKPFGDKLQRIKIKYGI
jgi:energy-coupling factor transport system substrate-specific component